MFFQRTILPSLIKELETPQAVVITGMRRTGKTTILQHVYGLVASDNKAFFDLENPLHAKYFDNDNFDAILPSLSVFGIDSSKKAYIFLDEIQNLPVISRVIKYLIDHFETKFFVTGSSSYYLKNLFPESLAGRKMVFEIFPLTFSEFLNFKGVERRRTAFLAEKAAGKSEAEWVRLKPFFDEYFAFGGFPGVVLENDYERKKKLLEDVLKSYFEQDVKTLANLEDRSKLRDLVFLLSARVASNVEINKLASELAISRAKIYAYLEFLEQTYFISLLPRFSQSVDRSAAGRKKLFFADGGLANFFGKASEGQILENSVFQSLRTTYPLSFFLKKEREIDFILDGKVAAEVKTTVSRQDIYGLRRMSETIGIKEFYVLSRNWYDGENVILISDL